MRKKYYIYIITNKYKSVFYTGVTNDLKRRIFKHKNKLIEGFSKKYNINTLVYYEEYHDINEAIEREKQVKDYRREKKLELVKSINRDVKDIEL